VHTESNASGALRYLDTAPVDVLFTDINLDGGMDGTDLARRARVLHPDLTVVYASGRSSRLDPDIAVPNSVFVPKPYNPQLVGPLLTRAVGAANAGFPDRARA
jgi:CheY-like chemotaxis protein